MISSNSSSYSANVSGKRAVSRQFCVEIAMRSNCDSKTLSEAVEKYFQDIGEISPGLFNLSLLPLNLQKLIEEIRVEELGSFPQESKAPVSTSNIRYSVFKIFDDEPDDEVLDEGDIPVHQKWLLPHREFSGSWESLYFDSQVKSELIDFSEAAMFFAQCKVDPKTICWNRVVLFHGPPGTGKTTLARALAHKLSIRHSNRYSSSVLLEINAHSLFSKYFSESGKLVMKMFATISDMLSDPDCFVAVLIDEVESLTAARRAGGNEPTDQLRVVNAVLTQLDALRHFTNCLVIATTNITGSIDAAFLDRADMKIAVGNPPVGCRYDILKSCIEEMTIKGVLKECPLPLPSYRELISLSDTEVDEKHLTKNGFSLKAIEMAEHLLSAARVLDGFSGRSLRKLPLQAFGMFVRRPAACRADKFIDVLVLAANREVDARQKLGIDHMEKFTQGGESKQREALSSGGSGGNRGEEGGAKRNMTDGVDENIDVKVNSKRVKNL